MFLLPPFLQRLFKEKKGTEERAYHSEVGEVQFSVQDTPSEQLIAVEEAGEIQTNEKTTPQELEIFPEDPAVRRLWFLLTIRERQVLALLCMGYRNYEIASILVVGYPTVQTHLQNIFLKFGLRRRREIREALMSWRAEEWWSYHHY